MGVGVTGGPGVQPLARRPVRNRLLGVLWHGVVLGVRSQDGPALAERRQERRRHPGRAFLHLEPLGPQELTVGARRSIFAEGRLGVVPDLLVELGQPLPVRLDPVEHGLLLAADRDHGDLLLRLGTAPARYFKIQASKRLITSGRCCAHHLTSASSIFSKFCGALGSRAARSAGMNWNASWFVGP